jgi:Tfp pilus assembly protein PilF
MDPNNAVAYAYRGLTKMALKQNEAAAADFARALEIDPNNGTASNGLAVLAGQR